MADAAAINININGNASGAVAATKSLSDAVKGVGDKATATAFKFNQITDALKNIASIAKSVFANLFGDSVRIANQFDKMSKQTGIAADSLQRLGYAAKQEHGSVEALSQGLKFLNRNMGEAAGGNKDLVEAFGQIGIAADQIKNAKPEDAFKRLADVMANDAIPQSEKTALAMKIMGRGAMELGPMLALGGAEIERLGRQAEQLGVVMSDSAISSAKAWDDAMTTISEGGQGIKNTVLEILAPALKDFAEWVDENVPPLIQWIREEMVEFADTVVVTWQAIGDVLMPVFESWVDSIKEAIGYLGDLTGASDLSMQGLDSFSDVLLGGVEVLLKWGVTLRTTFNESVAAIEHWGAVAGTVLGTIFGNLANSLPRVGELLKELAGLFVDGFRNIGDAIVGAGKGIGAAFDAMMEGNFSGMGDAFMREFDKGMNDIDARFRDRSARLKKIWGDMDLFGGLDDALKAERARYEAELKRIGDSSAEEKRLIEGWIDSIDDKIDARKREREAAKAAAAAEREAREEAKRLAAAQRDAAGAAHELAGALGAVGGAGGRGPSGGGTALAWDQPRTPNPPAGPAIGAPSFGAWRRARGGLDQPGARVWGAGFFDVQTHRTRLDAVQAAEREALRRQYDEEAQLINRNKKITQDERDKALADLRKRHREDMEKFRDKQRAERDGDKKRVDKKGQDEQRQQEQQAQRGRGRAPARPAGSVPGPAGDIARAMQGLQLQCSCTCTCICGGGGGGGGTTTTPTPTPTPGRPRTVPTPGGGGGGGDPLENRVRQIDAQLSAANTGSLMLTPEARRRLERERSLLMGQIAFNQANGIYRGGGGGGGGGGAPSGAGGGDGGPGMIASAFGDASRAKDSFAANVTAKTPQVTSGLDQMAGAAQGVADAVKDVGKQAEESAKKVEDGAKKETDAKKKETEFDRRERERVRRERARDAADDAGLRFGTRRVSGPKGGRDGGGGGGGGGTGAGGGAGGAQQQIDRATQSIRDAGPIRIDNARGIEIRDVPRINVRPPGGGGGEFDLSRYRGGLATTGMVEEISRRLGRSIDPNAPGGPAVRVHPTNARLSQFGALYGQADLSRIRPGAIGFAQEVNQDVRVDVNLTGVKVTGEYDVKALATDLGRFMAQAARLAKPQSL